MLDQSENHHGGCYCGAVKVEVEGDPVFTSYCHCHSCRTWHSAPIAALSAWPADAVTVKGEVVQSRHYDESERTACARCGGSVLTGKPGLGWRVVYPMTLANTDFKYTPAMHIFYEERVMDINDGLPKFADVPTEAGGSGVMVDEPDRSGWRG